MSAAAAAAAFSPDLVKGWERVRVLNGGSDNALVLGMRAGKQVRTLMIPREALLVSDFSFKDSPMLCTASLILQGGKFVRLTGSTPSEACCQEISAFVARDDSLRDMSDAEWFEMFMTERAPAQ